MHFPLFNHNDAQIITLARKGILAGSPSPPDLPPKKSYIIYTPRRCLRAERKGYPEVISKRQGIMCIILYSVSGLNIEADATL